MSTNEVVRKIKIVCKKKYGTKVTIAQVKAVLEALRDVTYDECKEGGCVKLRGFMTIRGILTKIRKLPDGTYNIPRYKIQVKLSEIMVEDFRKDVTAHLREDFEIDESEYEFDD